MTRRTRRAVQALAALALTVTHSASAQQFPDHANPHPAPSSTSATDTAAVIAWIQRAAYPLPTGRDGVDLPPLTRMIRDARIIGVGESLHHTHELLSLRLEVLKPLVLNHGVRGVAMETGYADALLLEDWLDGATSTEPDFTKALPFVEEGKIEELRAALRWIREYNRRVPYLDRVRFFGIDLSMAGGTLSTPVQHVLAFLDQVDPELAARSRAALEAPVREVGDGWPRDAHERFSRLSPGSRAALESGIAAVREALQRNRFEYVSRSEVIDYDRARQVARVAEQTLAFMRAPATDEENPRDHALAENAAWALDQLRGNAKLVVWAHNAHVQQQAIDVPAMQLPHTVPSMGELLHRRFGREYLAVGTAVGAYEDGAAADHGTIDRMLASAADIPFVLPIADVREGGAVADWLGQPRLMRFQETYIRVIPRWAFDALLYVPRATPARRIGG